MKFKLSRPTVAELSALFIETAGFLPLDHVPVVCTRRDSGESYLALIPPDLDPDNPGDEYLESILSQSSRMN